MADYHRKIELQNPDDLQYLIANVRRAANEKINQALPPMEGEDTMRPLVEEMVHDYITSVFQSASENLTINGLPPPSTILSQTSNHTAAPLQIEEHEPLDNKLSAKAVALLQQEEQLLEEIAALRRKMPGVAVEKAKEGYRKAGEADEEALRIMQEVIREDVEESRKVGLGVGLLERQQGMETNWGRGISGLEGLKSGLPETVAKKERAERAENYVISPEKKG